MSATATPTDTPPRTHVYRCECACELQVFGRGRHRLYFPGTDAALADPVMSGVCPECGRPLPGKHVASTDVGT